MAVSHHKSPTPIDSAHTYTEVTTGQQRGAECSGFSGLLWKKTSTNSSFQKLPKQKDTHLGQVKTGKAKCWHGKGKIYCWSRGIAVEEKPLGSVNRAG